LSLDADAGLRSDRSRPGYARGVFMSRHGLVSMMVFAANEPQSIISYVIGKSRVRG
jgi:hypothetical protein